MKHRKVKKANFLEGDIRKIVNFILEYRTLKHIPRASLAYLKSPIPENVAEHSFYTAIIAWTLSKLEGGDEEKVLKMALIHDLAEVRGGEKNLINKFYTIPNNEIKIIKEVARDYNLEKIELPELLQEFNEVKTKEAKIVKDADVLSQMLLEKENVELGNKTASKWLLQSLIRLKTKTGKRLGKKLIEVAGDEWWLEIDRKYLPKTKFL